MARALKTLRELLILLIQGIQTQDSSCITGYFQGSGAQGNTPEAEHCLSHSRSSEAGRATGCGADPIQCWARQIDSHKQTAPISAEQRKQHPCRPLSYLHLLNQSFCVSLPKLIFVSVESQSPSVLLLRASDIKGSYMD